MGGLFTFGCWPMVCGSGMGHARISRKGSVMAVAPQQVPVPRTLSNAMEPLPAECLACFIRRTVVFGCSGTLGLVQCWDLAREGMNLLVARMLRQGAHCDCEVVTTIFEPCIFQIRTDDGLLIPPRALPEVRRCYGVKNAVEKPCGMWSRVIPHQGPPWS